MRTSLTSEEIRHYQDRGFLVVEDFLSAEELDLWRAQVFDAVEARGTARFATRVHIDPNGHVGDGREPRPADWFVQRVNLWQTHEGVRDLMLDERLGRLASALAGVAGVRIWHDQALFKQPYASPTAFHLDVPYWSFTTPDAISMWVALDDATVQNGCLYFLPGTHKARRFDNAKLGREIGALFDVYPEWMDIEPVPCPMPAGSASFHNGLLAHGAGANMTPYYRRAMTCAYMPDGCTFNGQPNVLPPEMLDRLEVGDLLDDDGQNPLVYRARDEVTAVPSSGTGE